MTDAILMDFDVDFDVLDVLNDDEGIKSEPLELDLPDECLIDPPSLPVPRPVPSVNNEENRPCRCRFVVPEGVPALFQPTYKRSYSGKARNLRCFPMCSTKHNKFGFCGSSISVEVTHPVTVVGVQAFAEFVEVQKAESTLLRTVTLKDLPNRIESRMHPFKPWYRGIPIEMQASDDNASITTIFEFNNELRSWNTLHLSGKKPCLFRVFVYKQTGASLELLETLQSPVFSVFNRKRQKKTTGASPSSDTSSPGSESISSTSTISSETSSNSSVLGKRSQSGHRTGTIAKRTKRNVGGSPNSEISLVPIPEATKGRGIDHMRRPMDIGMAEVLEADLGSWLDDSLEIEAEAMFLGIDSSALPDRLVDDTYWNFSRAKGGEKEERDEGGKKKERGNKRIILASNPLCSDDPNAPSAPEPSAPHEDPKMSLETTSRVASASGPPNVEAAADPASSRTSSSRVNSTAPSPRPSPRSPSPAATEGRPSSVDSKLSLAQAEGRSSSLDSKPSVGEAASEDWKSPPSPSPSPSDVEDEDILDKKAALSPPPTSIKEEVMPVATAPMESEVLYQQEQEEGSSLLPYFAIHGPNSRESSITSYDNDGEALVGTQYRAAVRTELNMLAERVRRTLCKCTCMLVCLLILFVVAFVRKRNSFIRTHKPSQQHELVDYYSDIKHHFPDPSPKCACEAQEINKLLNTVCSEDDKEELCLSNPKPRADFFLANFSQECQLEACLEADNEDACKLVDCVDKRNKCDESTDGCDSPNYAKSCTQTCDLCRDIDLKPSPHTACKRIRLR